MRLIVLALLISSTMLQPAAGPPAGVLRVTFLGTGGGPAVGIDRAGPASLVEFGSEVLLIDAGRGTVERLQGLNRSPGSISQIFLTHLHSDHTVGLPEVWLSGWWRGRPAAPLEVRGPEGTRDMMAPLQQAFSYDVAIRSGPPENLNREKAARRIRYYGRRGLRAQRREGYRDRR